MMIGPSTTDVPDVRSWMLTGAWGHSRPVLRGSFLRFAVWIAWVRSLAGHIGFAHVAVCVGALLLFLAAVFHPQGA